MYLFITLCGVLCDLQHSSFRSTYMVDQKSKGISSESERERGSASKRQSVFQVELYRLLQPSLRNQASVNFAILIVEAVTKVYPDLRGCTKNHISQ